MREHVHDDEVDDEAGACDLEYGFDELDQNFELEFLFDPFNGVEFFEIKFHGLKGKNWADDEETHNNACHADEKHDRETAVDDDLERREKVGGDFVFKILLRGRHPAKDGQRKWTDLAEKVGHEDERGANRDNERERRRQVMDLRDLPFFSCVLEFFWCSLLGFFSHTRVSLIKRGEKIKGNGAVLCLVQRLYDLFY